MYCHFDMQQRQLPTKPRGIMAQPHSGGAAQPPARAKTATDYLREILDVLQADRLTDLPSDGTDYRDYQLPAAAGDLYIDTSTQFGYVYIPNAPRDLTIYAGARGQYLGTFAAGTTVQFRLPRVTGLTLVYGAGGAASSLTVVFSARPLDVDVQPAGSASLYGAAYEEDTPHVSGDTGVMMLGVRNDSGSTTFADTNGDYAPIALTSAGAVEIAALSATSHGDNLTASTRQWTSTNGTGLGCVVSMLYNGSTHDRPRNNSEGTALASAVRTATTQSADITNYNHRGVRIWLDVTAITATPSITLSVQGRDPMSGKYVTIFTGAAVTTVSTNEYVVYPGVTETANVDAATPLPRTWRVNITHANADSITYSVGYCLIL